MKSRIPTATYEQVIAALFSFSWLASVVIAAHHHDHFGRGIFFVNPFLTHDRLRQVELVLFITGWLLMCLGPLFIAIRMLLVTDMELRFLRFISLFYPASVLLIQATLYVQSHHLQKPYQYLRSNYWFAVTDIVVPIGLFALDVVVRKSRKFGDFSPESELVANDKSARELAQQAS